MTVQSTSIKVVYSGDGSTTVFSYPYYFLDEEDLVVVVKDAAGTETIKTLTTDYTVTGEGEDSGGTVTMTSAPAVGESLIIYRDPAMVQDLDLQNNDTFDADLLEEVLDKLVMISQRLHERMDRSVQLPEGWVSGSLKFPEPEAGKALIGNAAADGWTNGPTASEIENAQTYASQASGYADDAKAAAVDAIENAQTYASQASGYADDAKAAAVDAEAAAAKVPDVATGDADKVLQVKDDESGAEWNALSAIVTALYNSGSAKVSANANGAVVTGRIYQTAGYAELFVPAGAMIPRTTNGAAAATVELATNDIMLDVYDFDGATSEGVGFWLFPPYEWGRTVLKVKPVWMPSAGASQGDGVSWEFKTLSLNDDYAADAALGAGANCNDVVLAGTSGDLHIGAATSLTVSHSIGGVMYVEISRDVADAADTMTEDARLIGLIMQFKLSNDQNPW